MLDLLTIWTAYGFCCIHDRFASEALLTVSPTNADIDALAILGSRIIRDCMRQARTTIRHFLTCTNCIFYNDMLIIHQDTFLCGALWDTAVAGFINSVWSRRLILKKDINAVLEKVTWSGQVKSSQVKSTLFRQASPISHWLVSKGALRKL